MFWYVCKVWCWAGALASKTRYIYLRVLGGNYSSLLGESTTQQLQYPELPTALWASSVIVDWVAEAYGDQQALHCTHRWARIRLYGVTLLRTLQVSSLESAFSCHKCLATGRDLSSLIAASLTYTKNILYCYLLLNTYSLMLLHPLLMLSGDKPLPLEA
jgi:hypothetical protein